MRALVIVNPKASTTSKRTIDVLLSAIRHELKAEVAETSHREHAIELGRQARQDGLDLVIVLGGDGTINEAVNGLLHDGAGPDVPALGIVPGGNTNVFARNLGIPLDPVEATGALLQGLRSNSRRAVGLGRADDRWFVFAAGMGLDADVVRTVEERRSEGATASTALYVRAAVRRLLATPKRRQPGPITLRWPGAEPVPGLHLVIVTNCQPWTYLGPRPVQITPHASFEDRLDAVGFARLGLAGSLRHVLTMVATRRGPRGRDIVSVHDVPEVTLQAPTPQPCHVDGDYLGRRDTMICRAVPQALRVVCDEGNTGS